MPTEDYRKELQTQRQKWSELIDISNNLLTLAQRNDWVGVDTLSLQREQMLEIFFRQALAEDLIETIQNGIKEISKNDEEIVRLVKKNRNDLAEEMTALTNKRKQIKDYISNSR